jgi:hypothetical protein
MSWGTKRRKKNLKNERFQIHKERKAVEGEPYHALFNGCPFVAALGKQLLALPFSPQIRHSSSSPIYFGSSSGDG